MTNKEAIEFLKNMIGEKSASTIGKEGFYAELMGYHVEALKLAIKALENEPKKGEWTEHEDYNGDTYYTCSNCGGDWATIEGTPSDNMMNYCPNCGAQMDKEADK